MSRQIKFRAWDVDGKQMVKWNDMWGITRACPDGVAVHIACGDHCYLMPEKMCLMQFTGLYDRNGREIYEGDILRLGSSIAVPVYYVAGAFWAGAVLLFTESESAEVIGNVWEDPELLEEEESE